jgi:Fur family transcriptional regulator, peroxide stress response regulator
MSPTNDTIRQRFRQHRVRLTPQRAAIYSALAGTASHPTADDLYRAVKRRHPMISRNTVYYTLGVLRRTGLVREVNLGHEGARFDANMSLHHHLICLNCRQIQDVTDETLDCLTVSRSDFQVLGHRVEFHGYCAGCRRKEAAEPSSI